MSWIRIRSLIAGLVASIAILGASTASAAEFGFGGVDLRGGIAIPSEWDNGTTFGLSVEIGELTNGLYLHPAVRYSVAEETESIFGVDFGLEVTDLALGAEVRYFPAKGQRGWYFGGGVYVHFLDREVVLGGTSVGSVSNEQIGPGGVVGYRWSRSGLSFFTEARYDLADVFDRAEVLIGIGFGGE
jgi:hypothetical protein